MHFKNKNGDLTSITMLTSTVTIMSLFFKFRIYHFICGQVCDFWTLTLLGALPLISLPYNLITKRHRHGAFSIMYCVLVFFVSIRRFVYLYFNGGRTIYKMMFLWYDCSIEHGHMLTDVRHRRTGDTFVWQWYKYGNKTVTHIDHYPSHKDHSHIVNEV